MFLSAIATAAAIYGGLVILEKTVRRHETVAATNPVAARERTVRAVDGVVRDVPSSALALVPTLSPENVSPQPKRARLEIAPRLASPELSASLSFPTLARVENVIPIQPVALAPLPPPAATIAAATKPTDAGR
jgi:hypothetical protein